jgi:hypothetical protein
MASEHEKTKAYERGLNKKTGARSPLSPKFADKDEVKEYERGRRDRAYIDQQANLGKKN